MNQNQYDEENMNKKYDEMFSGNLDGTRHAKNQDITIGEKSTEEDEGNIYKDIYMHQKQMEQFSSQQNRNSTGTSDTGRYNEDGYSSSGYHTDGYSGSGYSQEKYRSDEELLSSPLSSNNSGNIPSYYDKPIRSLFSKEEATGKVSVGDDNVQGSFRVTGNDSTNISHASVHSENSLPVSTKVSSRETGLSHKVQSTENGITSRMRSDNPAFARGQADFTSYNSLINSFGHNDGVIYEFGWVTNSKKELKELRKTMPGGIAGEKITYGGAPLEKEKLNYKYCLSDKSIDIALSKYGVSNRELQAMINHDVSLEKMSWKEKKQFDEAYSMRNSIMTKIAKGEALNSSEIAALQAIKQSKKYDFKGIRGGNLSDDKSSKWKKFKGENKETLGLSKKVIAGGASMAASGAKYIVDSAELGEGADVVYKSGKAVVSTGKETVSFGKAIVTRNRTKETKSGKASTNSLAVSDRIKSLASSGADAFARSTGMDEGYDVIQKGGKIASLPGKAGKKAYQKFVKMKKRKVFQQTQKKAQKAAKKTQKTAKGIMKTIGKIFRVVVMSNPMVFIILLIAVVAICFYLYQNSEMERAQITYEELPEAEMVLSDESDESGNLIGKISAATSKLWTKQKAYEKNLSDADLSSPEIDYGIPLKWQKLPEEYPSIASSPGVIIKKSGVIAGYNFSKYWGAFSNTNYQYAFQIKNKNGEIKKIIHTSILAPAGMTGDLGTYTISDDYRVDIPPEDDDDDTDPHYEFPVNENSEGYKNLFNDERLNENFVVTFEYRGSAYTRTFTANKETSYYRGKYKEAEDGENNRLSKHVYNVENLYRAFVSMGIGVTYNYPDESEEFLNVYYSKLFDYVLDRSTITLTETMKQANMEDKTKWSIKYKGKKYEADPIPTPFTKVELIININECGIQDLIAGDDSTVEWFEENGSKAFTETMKRATEDGVKETIYTPWKSWWNEEDNDKASSEQDMALRYIELSNDDWDRRFEGLIIPGGNAMSRIPSATINRIMKEIKENNGGKLSKTQESFLRTALEEVGKYTYNYGSRVTDTENPPAQLDCSGFVSYVLYKGGVDKVFTDRIAAQYADCYESVDYRAISPHFEKLTPGTLVSANKENGEGSSAHVVIYMGIFKWADEKEASPHFVECTTATAKDYKGIVKELSGSMVSGAGNMEIIKGYLYACCPKGFIYGRED